MARTSKFSELQKGGCVAAQFLGAARLDARKATLEERQLVNVVEEMAIAAGTSVPPVYVVEEGMV